MGLFSIGSLGSNMFTTTGQRLIRKFDHEITWIEPWGKDSLRVRSTKCTSMPEEDWALTEPVGTGDSAQIEILEDAAVITNGLIRAEISGAGRIRMYKKTDDGEEMILSEYTRNRLDVTADYCSALEIDAREFLPLIGGDYELTQRFESLDREERIYGMGQYQQPYLNLKGMELELAHRNSQASVPFCISSLGYGLLWNNPAVGSVVFGENVMTWRAKSTKKLDYWITAADSPAHLEENYASVTGHVPMMPDYAMGFWQCKLRYQTQDELLEIAREYKRRNLPISVIVIDFFHWPLQGEWKFDPTYWPDPDAMIAELQKMGIELMVSIWPTVDYRSENFAEMLEKGYLIRTERGVRISMTYQGNTIHFDATDPEARKYVWQKAKKNYYDKGIRIFWLDEAEPEYDVYHFDNYRYSLGSDLQVGNIYPVMYAKAFFDGMREEGQDKIINLLRCAWAGSQKYGALVWSGDIHSSFDSLRNQLPAGLNMALAGIPWWTTDIGGFQGGDVRDPDFPELMIRWFEYGCFCPVMRLHGCRIPEQPQVGTTGGAECRSGAPNEVWSYGEEAYTIMCRYLRLREALRPYVTKCMEEASTKGTPVIRPLFFDFPKDDEAWKIEDQYMFGAEILVAPILYHGQRARKVYLPKNTEWVNVWTGECFDGGRMIDVAAPLDQIPVFAKKGFSFPKVSVDNEQPVKE